MEKFWVVRGSSLYWYSNQLVSPLSSPLPSSTKGGSEIMMEQVVSMGKISILGTWNRANKTNKALETVSVDM